MTTLKHIMLYCIIILFICIFLNMEIFTNSTIKKRIDIVIARYAEPLDWLCNDDILNNIQDENVDTNIFIYNKGKDNINLCNLPSHIRVYIKNIENVGRCDHTYLYHIIQNYYNLGDVTIFLPGSADMYSKYDKTKDIISKSYTDLDSVFICNKYDEDILSIIGDFQLDNWMSSNEHNSHQNTEEKLLPCNERPFKIWYEKIFGNVNINHITFYGIFSVSQNDIHNRPIDFYEHLISYVNTHHNPEAGHYIERSWIAIFKPDNSRLF